MRKLSYELPSEGSYFASATVKSEDGKIIRRSVDFWFTIEPNRKKLTILKERIGESIAAMARLSNPLAMNFKAEAENILSSVQELEKNADAVLEFRQMEMILPHRLKKRILKLHSTCIK